MKKTFKNDTTNKKRVSELFLTQKEKTKNDNEIAKKFLDYGIASLGRNADRVAEINEYWNLHKGIWPEMVERMKEEVLFKTVTDEGEEDDVDIVREYRHYGVINNVTKGICGSILMQPLIPIVRDHSMQGRKYRVTESVNRLKENYFQDLYQPQLERIRSEYLTENGIDDIIALTPEEQRQVQADLEARYRSGVPRDMVDDMAKIKTPNERLTQVLLNNDMKEFSINEKYSTGGEMAVVTDEEYFRILKKGIKPSLEVLNSKWVDWIGDEETDHCEDGSMAKYEQYLTPHTFLTKWGRLFINNQSAMKDMSQLFTEIPGYGGIGSTGGYNDDRDPGLRALEFDFLDDISRNPERIQNHWGTRAGQEDIKNVYQHLTRYHTAGSAILEEYLTWKWTEAIKLLIRKEGDTLVEYLVGHDYKFSPERGDIKVYKYAINRTWHGVKVADKLYGDVEKVGWQYAGLHLGEPKLTIFGRKYGTTMNNGKNVPLMRPAIEFQESYNISKNKMEELKKNDLGKILAWNTKAKVKGWTDNQFMSSIVNSKNIPYSTDMMNKERDGNKFFEVLDHTSTASMEMYRKECVEAERDIFKAMYVNPDAMGLSSQYASNALAQNNIAGSDKQLASFHNKRRIVKERVLNAFIKVSKACLVEDKVKQDRLFDDFTRTHIQVNAEELLGDETYLYVVDDYRENQKVEAIRAQIMTMMQNSSVKDVLAIMNAETSSEMSELAELAEKRNQEAAANAQQAAEANEKYKADLIAKVEEYKAAQKAMLEDRKNEVTREVALLNSKTMENAADVNKDSVADSLEKAKEEIRSKEKIAAAELEFNYAKIEADIKKAKSSAK
jgi:hypothetical protein